jgi:DUF1680 family protein
MSQIKKEAKYIDTVERALYNTLLSGISLEGNRFFYVNPLEVWPESCMPHTSKRHVKTERQKWFGVACCPPNIARTLASLGEYIYSTSEQEIYVNLFISNQTKCLIKGNTVKVNLESGFPSDSKINITLEASQNEFALNIRIPNYAVNPKVIVNGIEIENYEMKDGYARVYRKWDGKNDITLEFDMPAVLMRANPKVRMDIGKAAIIKGPVVYCLEEIDNGDCLAGIEVKYDTKLEEHYEEELLGGTLTITAQATRVSHENWREELYKQTELVMRPTVIKAIPYCLWNNRGKGEMLVWIRCS